MAAVKDIDLSEATVIYNGVVFGGSTADEKCLPPRFSLSSQVVYDSTMRVYKGIKHTLGVQTIFYEDSQAAMAANMAALRTKLSKVGGLLEIKGLGLGLDSIIDIDGGPRPLGMPQMKMLGANGWELLWSVEFTVSPCYSISEISPTAEDELLTLNYSTAWSNDFEGRCTRTIQGHYEIVHVRDPDAANGTLPRADIRRGDITISLPTGFRRIANQWVESENHKRMEFSVVDEQMNGDPYPVDIIEADGDEAFSTNPLTWANGTVTLNLTYRVAPGKARTIGGLTFLAAAVSKQASMIAVLPEGAVVIPKSLTLRNGKYQSAQVTSGSISWMITGCVEDFLSAGGLWKKVGDNTYSQWKASVASLWVNRGNANVTAIRGDDVIIDLCSQASSASIGSDTVTIPSANPADSLSFTCPEVPAGGGWMAYDLRVTVHREDHQTTHRRAVTYEPDEPSGDPASGSVNLGGPEYSSDSDTEHVVEYNGIPSMLVIMRFKAFRYVRLPDMPKITTVGGLPATLVTQEQEGPYLAGDLMGCPYYAIRGYRIYRVNGYVPTIKANGQKTSCGNSTVPEEY